MPELDLSQVMWRKSSRSGNGPNCVEVGVWHKSSLSGSGQNCVEVAATDNTQAEARADADRLFLVRDSKDPNGLVLTFTPSVWNAFLTSIKDGPLTDLA